MFCAIVCANGQQRGGVRSGFSARGVERIKAAVRDHPQWTRADLARHVCDWLDWRAANGGKAVNCRVALVRLERRGLITLPPPRRRVRSGASRWAAIPLQVPSHLEGSVKELRGLKLVLVSSKNRELDGQWKKLVATYHYLGYRPLCGAQLRYLIVCEHGYVGALGFSAAALYLKARERWIGWSHAARQCHLPEVVANFALCDCAWGAGQEFGFQSVGAGAETLARGLGTSVWL